MTFCSQSVQSFGSSNTKDNGIVDLASLLQNHQKTIADGQKPADVLGKSKTPHFSPLFVTMMTATNRDPGGIGFIDDVGGSVDGLMSCTESLGFESSDERRVDDQFENLDVIKESCSGKEAKVGSRRKREHVKREVKKFPPPLSSLNQNGKPTFFLRPVRRDGKLDLLGVKIGQSEIFRASRQDGRLRLQFVNKNEDEEDIEDAFEQEEKEEDEEVLEEEDENVQEIQEHVQEVVEEKVGEEEVEARVEGWQIPASQEGDGEGFQKCHKQVSHRQNHHHNDLHVWRQHCMIIR